MNMEKKLSSTSTRLTTKLFWENSQSSLKWLGVRYYSLLILWTMKKVLCKLFKFEELSKEVRQKIVEEKTTEIAYDVMSYYNQDYMGTLEKFSEIMGIKVNYEIDYGGKWFNVKFTSDYPLMGSYLGKELYAEDICGKYLRRWMNNNFSWVKPMKRFYKNGKKRVSRILEESLDSCPMTGMCYDCFITEVIKEKLSKPIPNNYSLEDIVFDALENFFSEWQKEYEYWCDNANDCIEEELRQRWEEKLFFADGTMFNGTFEEIA